MISLTAQYALRAILLIAQRGGDSPVLARELAAKAKIPKQYLSTILRSAVRAGLLQSMRGRGGGFVLARPAAQMTLAEVLIPFDSVAGCMGCPFGLPRCSDANPCLVHDYWKPVASHFRQMLSETTLASVVGRSLVQTSVGRRAKRPLRTKRI